jgi:hypothetical protein
LNLAPIPDIYRVWGDLMIRHPDNYREAENKFLYNKLPELTISDLFMNTHGRYSIVKNNLPGITNWVIIICILFLNFQHHQWNSEERVIEWDIKSYYAYLPAVFIYKDISLNFRKENINKFGDLIWPVRTPAGKDAILTTMGMSILYSPFFLLAHGYAKLSDYEADGYTKPYRFALVFSALFYLALGLYFLRKILARYFSVYVSAITLFAIAIGTNLLYYASYSAAMPHVYNFTLITAFIYLVIRWYEKPCVITCLLIGLLSGLITLIRPTNILVLILLLLWNIKSKKEFKDRILFYIKNFHWVLLMFLAFIAVWFPQFLYWKYVSGSYLYFSYGEVGGNFFFNNPQIFNILLSYKKGWLVYTPLMFFALAGIFLLIKKTKGIFVPILVFTVLYIYILSSWWCWWYGGAFGLRSFIDSYGILAIPFATFVDFVLRKKKIIRIISLIVIACLVWYNTFQISQYNHQAIHYWWMNKEAYWENFLRLRPTAHYWEIITLPDYEKAREGIYVEIKPEEKNKTSLTASPEEIKREIKKEIRSNKIIIDSLQKKSEIESIPLDTLISNHATSIFKNTELEKYIKQIIVNKLEASIRSNPDMMKYIEEKARNRNIDIDSMIYLDAVWLFENNQY